MKSTPLLFKHPEEFTMLKTYSSTRRSVNMLKTSTLFVSMLLLAACHSLNNRHDTLAVQCDINGRTADRVLVKFTNPGGVELSPEQVAQLQVQYQGMNSNQALTLTSRACVALPVGAARVKAKISGDAPLTADLVLDASAATDTIHKVELEAPGVLIMGLKCPKNGLLAADSLDNLVDVKKSIGRLNGYKVDLALYNARNEKVRSLFAKDIQDEGLALPSSFAIQNVDEGTYKVELSVLDSYHDKSGAEAKSQCSLTVRRSCAKDEDFDPATVSCVPKLCDNAYRVGAKWTDSLALQRGEGRYECRLENGKAEKVLLSHTCQGGFFKSKDSCLAAKEIAGNCARLETDEVVCWGTTLGKDMFPVTSDINYETTFKFQDAVKNLTSRCVELASGKIQCWDFNPMNPRYEFISDAQSPKDWLSVLMSYSTDMLCDTAAGTDCNFRVTQIESAPILIPAPQAGISSCLVDTQGQVWCYKSALPKNQNITATLKAGDFYRVDLPSLAREVKADGYTYCVLLIDGHVLCWGDNTVGSTGANKSDIIVDRASYVVESKGKQLQNIKQISSSRDYNAWRTTYALTQDGRVLAWGTNIDGMLANGTPGEDDEGNPLFSRFAVPVSVNVKTPIIQNMQ
jgi:hypothetical protein